MIPRREEILLEVGVDKRCVRFCLRRSFFFLKNADLLLLRLFSRSRQLRFFHLGLVHDLHLPSVRLFLLERGRKPS